MTSERVLRPELADKGGHFYRSDFQVHTPRDTQWTGAHPVSDADRKVWAEDFVAQCRSKALHAVAITDHHDFAFFPFVSAAAKNETDADGDAIAAQDQLVVFPGLELTLTVPCQAILILDADFPEFRLSDVLKALLFDPIDPSLPTIPQTTALTDSGDLKLLHDKLDKHDWLRGRYIVLPNVSPAGHQTLLRKGLHAKYIAMPSVGGYLDGDMSLFDKKKGKELILAGKDKAWGNKRLALFQTSDSRADGFSDLGVHSTWVKWSKPTAEAIRQACLAQESRIAQVEPAFPNVWLSRIVVSNSKFMGRIDVALNPQYTALIGGRGTGKSTILDYLRWALCDQPANATEDDEVADPRIRQRRLIDATLVPLEAHVEIHCTINGIAHVVRRYAKTGEVQLKVGEGEYEIVREAVIQSLLPIQAYSQKQLSSVAIRLDELLRFVTSPIQRQLEDIDRKLAEVSGRLRENYGTLQRFRVLGNDINKSQVRISSLGGQAQSLRDGLAGLSDEDRLTLDSKSGYDDAKAATALWHQQVELVESSVVGTIGEIDSALARLEFPDSAPEAVKADANELLNRTRAAIETLRARIIEANDGFSAGVAEGGLVAKAAKDVEEHQKTFEAKYAAVKLRSSAHEVKLAELATIEAQQRTSRNLLQTQQGQLAQLSDPQTRHHELRAELASLNAERSQALADQCEVLSVSSDGFIRASLAAGRGFAGAQEKLKGLVAGSNVRASKQESLFEQLASESDPVATWEVVLDELESLVLLEADADISREQTPVLSGLGLSIADQKKIAPRLTPDGWLDLSLAPLTDHPLFEYRSKEGEYIPFDSASAGQQATALLTTLLAQEGMPLVVDQPEDDLDSETVQQIVTKIWASKGGRQLIFSSHNANLVVNGDADLVLVCAYSNAGDQSSGMIKAEGAIDIKEIRSEVTLVMEGGERAFRLRKEKYGF